MSDLGSKHVWYLAEDGPSQLEAVLHHQHLPLVLCGVQLLVRLLGEGRGLDSILELVW